MRCSTFVLTAVAMSDTVNDAPATSPGASTAPVWTATASPSKRVTTSTILSSSRVRNAEP